VRLAKALYYPDARSWELKGYLQHALSSLHVLLPHFRCFLPYQNRAIQQIQQLFQHHKRHNLTFNKSRLLVPVMERLAVRAPSSTNWIPITATEPAAGGDSNAKSYPTVLNIAGTAVATVQVLLPVGGGILIPPKSEKLLPGAAASTLENGIALTVNGAAISFAEVTVNDPSTGASTNPSSTASSTTALQLSSTPTSVVASTTTTAGQSLPVASGTTSSPSTKPATATQSPKNGSALSTGAVAGIAIGCLAAGALLAGLILWFCWRRKKAPKSQYSGANTYAMASQEKGFSANTVPLPGVGHTAAGLGGGFPQPLEDKAITGDISKISNAIKNHVQSYYHTTHISSGLIDYDDLHALGPNLPISVGALTTLMGNAATREIALRFIIAWVVASRLQPSKDPAKSLLPSEVAQCYQIISTGDRGFQGMSSIEIAEVQLLTFA
jgi:hypothetical protein